MPNTRDGLSATHHYVTKAIAEVSFPATKRDISLAAGRVVIPVNPEKNATIDGLLENIELNEFSCAAAFFNALSASLLKK
jgi:hypothetical protein